jgi:hypothetical protein
MAKWTTSAEEVEHLRRIIGQADQCNLKGTVILKSGEKLYGDVLPSGSGNNAGEGGVWKCYASILVRTVDEEKQLDALDIENIIPGAIN